MATSENKLLDKNKIFFGLIHYILSEQKNVNWLIKTSLIDLTGISSVLEEKPYKKDSILDDVIDYVTEIKPYHVQFSHYFEHYQTASETVNIPGNDWLEPTINMRFDAIQSCPDINKLFFATADTLPSEPSKPERSDYDTEEEYIAALKKYYIALDTFNTTYNISGLTIFNFYNNKFYVRTYDQEDSSWSWEQSDETLSYNGYYCTTTPKCLYKVTVTDNNIDTLTKLTDSEILDFINSHKANRLFYIKYYDSSKKLWKNGGITDFDEIKKELNANFKGIEINGSIFDIENFGYDIFNYDESDYDSPTIIYDYYFVEKYDSNFNSDNEYFKLDTGFNMRDPSETSFKKVFVKAGDHRFSLNGSINVPSGYETQVYKVSVNGDINVYEDYEMDEGYTYIDIFSGLSNKEKIYVIVKKSIEDNDDKRPIVKFVYDIEGSSFNESSSDVLYRQFVKYDSQDSYYELKTPSFESGSNDKIAIQKRDSTDARSAFLNYTYDDNKIIIYTSTAGISIGDHIIMTSFDYKYLYDKIYTWEDRYGRSNNIVNLDGKTFLRARYEEDRPSELVVSYPLNSMFVYQYVNKNNYTIYFNDFKNELHYTTLQNDVGAVLYKDPKTDNNGMITSLYVNKISNFESPRGKALINSEIIEYKSVIEHEDTDSKGNVTKYWELTNLNRGIDGSTLYTDLLPKYQPKKMTHTIGDKIVPYNEDEWFTKEKNSIYKSYNILGNNILTYNCPTGVTLTSDINLTKIAKINLLKDVNEYSTELLIDSCNVVSGWYKLSSTGEPEPLQTTLKNETTETKYYGDWSLKINDDEIPFKSIYKDSSKENTYHICDIDLPDKYIGYKDTVIYSADDSFVYGCLPTDVNSFYISYVEGDYTYEIMQKVYKGQVDTYSDLPIKYQTKYDVYNIKDTNTNYYWNGKSWTEDDSTVDYNKYVLLNTTNNKVFRIEDNLIYEIGTKLTQETEGTDPQESEFTYSERLFGYINNDMVTRESGEVYAKIEGNKFISIQTILTIDETVNKGESIHINVIN